MNQDKEAMNHDSQDFDVLIGDYLSLWPTEIDVSQVFVDGERSPFKELISAHDIVEGRLVELADNKLWVLDWSVYKHLGVLAKQEKKLVLVELKLDPIKATYIEDIQKWREEFAKSN